eukprot:CAMPEP_0118929064 /NCGR_PEP_ID=MMETSP1169-20130426/6173_1 /TAXON_ID=36882 /ORGANISM="Pyramimonas obovata, Strain CCMP722" /LENGTH=74 /DNA_ID=CAMNT_0006871187 /DNA_START=386 /DNA_END=610 /DNA_ORIENTATION=-
MTVMTVLCCTATCDDPIRRLTGNRKNKRKKECSEKNMVQRDSRNADHLCGVAASGISSTIAFSDMETPFYMHSP